MRILLWGLGIPTIVLLSQILVWRIRRPVNDIKTLALMLLGAAAVFLLLCSFPEAVAALSLPVGWPSVAYAAAVAAAVSVLYLITYFGLDEKSPSALIVMAAQQSREGLRFEEACGLFSDHEFIVRRVEGMVAGGQMCVDEKGIRLTSKGRLFMEAFVLPRRIMGLKHWGG
jgi:hypothetical protein